jgi:hypothetical protein
MHFALFEMTQNDNSFSSSKNILEKKTYFLANSHSDPSSLTSPFAENLYKNRSILKMKTEKKINLFFILMTALLAILDLFFTFKVER